MPTRDMNETNENSAKEPGAGERDTIEDFTAPPEDGPGPKFSLSKHIKYFCIRTFVMSICRLATIVPERLVYRFCVGLSMVAYRRVPRFRRLARRHLDIAFGNEKSPEEIEEILRQTYVNYGKNLAEFLMLTYKSNEWIENRVNFNDPNWHIRTALEKGKGVVGLGGHFGSWELVAARIGLYKYPIVAVVKAQRDAIFSKFVMDTRTKWGNEYIFRIRGVRDECMRQLNKNKIIGLVADQNVTRRGVFVDFFGKKAATATGPAYIAMKAGVPVIPSFPARNPDDTITLHVLDPIPMRDTGNFEEDLAHNVQICSDAVEDFAREHPTEYYWWHRRWRTRPPGKGKE